MGNSLSSKEALIGELCRQYGARGVDVQRLLDNPKYVNLVRQRIVAYRQLDDNPVESEQYNQALKVSWELHKRESQLPGVGNPLLDNARIVSFMVIARPTQPCEHD